MKRRRLMRLDHDYREHGTYFVTMTHNAVGLFGKSKTVKRYSVTWETLRTTNGSEPLE